MKRTMIFAATTAACLCFGATSAEAAPENHHNASATCTVFTISNTQTYVETIYYRSNGGKVRSVQVPIGGSTPVAIPAGVTSIRSWDGTPTVELEPGLTTLVPQCQPVQTTTTVAPPPTVPPTTVPPSTVPPTTCADLGTCGVETEVERTPDVTPVSPPPTFVPSTVPSITTWTELPATGAATGLVVWLLSVAGLLVLTGAAAIFAMRPKRNHRA
jgi:hypothetical protein